MGNTQKSARVLRVKQRLKGVIPALLVVGLAGPTAHRQPQPAFEELLGHKAHQFIIYVEPEIKAIHWRDVLDFESWVPEWPEDVYLPLQLSISSGDGAHRLEEG